MELPDLATLPPISKFTERCKVVTIPAGAAPKDVTIQLPDADGAKVPARYTGSPPNLAVSDEVSVRATPQDTIKYLIMGTSGATVAQGGNPFDHILFVSSTNPNADYPTIAAAISAASAGDIILLDAETWALGASIFVDASKAITLMGLDPVNTIITATATETVRVTATGVSLRNLTIANTGTSTNSNCISDNFSGSDDLLIDNCILNKISGAATTSRGIRNTGGTGWEIRDTKMTITAGTTKYGYGADTAASDAKIIGGSFEGTTADVFLNHASASVELNDPVLKNNTLTLTAGTATGWYLDANGNQRSASADLDLDGNDIILDADADTKIDMSGGDDIIRINTAGNKAMDIDATGQVTKPLQCAFTAHNTVTDSNVTGDSTLFTLEFDTEDFDINGDYNNATDTFTAPVDGKYIFSVSVFVGGIVAAHIAFQVRMTVAGSPINAIFMNAFNLATGGQIIAKYSLYLDLDASDTVTVGLNVNGGTKVVDVIGGATLNTSFGGTLLG